VTAAIGIDLGGTKIEVIALGEDGDELVRRRIPTPRERYEASIDAIAGLVEDTERELGQRGTVGIGHPGALSPATGLIKNANSTWLNGKPFDVDVMRRLDRPVAFANDANCLGLSEATDGAGAGAHCVFSVILGTGVGGAVVIGGNILQGANAIGGEWGHNPLPWPNDDERPGPDCYCGLNGCIETWLSGVGLANDHHRVTGQRIAGPEIIANAEAGDALAEASVQRYEDRLARGLASIINVIDPDVIVLAGGLSNVDRLYRNVPARWDRYVFSDHVATKLKPPMHGDSTGVRGAAWLGRSLAS
jgi:fructokinase